MRLKLYRAADMAGAMASVRAELGADALILATRHTAGGVEITAALEPDPPAVALSDAPRPITGRQALLRHHGVPEAIAHVLVADELAAALANALPFRPLHLAPDAPPLLLIGPPGAGKTLSVARLATRLVLAGCMPVVITADAKRAGAVEELAAFTRLLGTDLITTSHPLALARSLATRPDAAPVLIDAPGIDPFDSAHRTLIAELKDAAGANLVLVLPTGLDPAESADLAAACAGLGAKLMIATRFDLSRRLGGILAAAAAGPALAEAGIGPGAADGLTPLTPVFLAERMQAALAAKDSRA